MFVVFEGLDGTGKTSVSRVLAEKTGGVYLKTPPPEFCRLRRKIQAEKNYYARFLFYLSSVVCASERTRQFPSSQIIVCDRYYYTSLADFFVRSGVQQPDRDFWLRIARRSCITPDLVVFCECQRKSRLARILKRNAKLKNPPPDDLSKHFERCMSQVFASLLSGEKVLRIDTSDASIGQLVTRIIEELNLK